MEKVFLKPWCPCAFVPGGEGVFKHRDGRAEAEDPLLAGSAGAPQQTERIPREGDPTPQPSECGRDAKRAIRRSNVSVRVTLVFVLFRL